MALTSIKITRRKIQIALGLLWLLDGALQLQYRMFTSAFTTYVITPASQGQPIIVSGPMHLFIHIFLWHPALFNSFAAITQLSLGILILWRQTTMYGLLASVGWGLFVWYVGEGLAGMTSGHASLLMGAPGAAVMYVLLALAVLPKRSDKLKTKHEEDHPAYWLAIVWSALWFIGAVFQLLPGQNTITDLSTMISSMATGTPGWMYALDMHTSNVIHNIGGSQAAHAQAMHMSLGQMATMSSYQDSGFWFILLLALVQLVIGIGVLFPGYIRKIAITAGIILALSFWIIGQSMGSYFTGLATDPNSGPLYVLLGVSILGCVGLDKKLAALGHRIENSLI